MARISKEKLDRSFEDVKELCESRDYMKYSQEIGRRILNGEPYQDLYINVKHMSTDDRELLKGDICVYVYYHYAKMEMERDKTSSESERLKERIKELEIELSKTRENIDKRNQDLADIRKPRRTAITKHDYHNMYLLKNEKGFKTSEIADIYNLSRSRLSKIMNNHIQLKDESDDEFISRKDTKGEWEW